MTVVKFFAGQKHVQTARVVEPKGLVVELLKRFQKNWRGSSSPEEIVDEYLLRMHTLCLEDAHTEADVIWYVTPKN